MSSHNHAPAIKEHGLQDDCPRCAEHAEHPERSLDEPNLRALVERTQSWIRDGESYPRSETEAVAMRLVEGHIIFARMARLAGVTL
jgi:hypothetical protein